MWVRTMASVHVAVSVSVMDFGLHREYIYAPKKFLYSVEHFLRAVETE